LHPIPDKSEKGVNQNILCLEYIGMTLEDLIKRQLDQSFDIDFIILLAAQIISAVKSCH
jgi:hypothetical protein